MPGPCVNPVEPACACDGWEGVKLSCAGISGVGRRGGWTSMAWNGNSGMGPVVQP